MASSEKKPSDSVFTGNNYYKILGLRKNATPATIKKKYIEKVKAYPPENYPEEFQAIRKAYEVLRDPEQRGQYDRIQAGIKTVEDYLAEIAPVLEQQEWQKAKTIINNASRDYPEEKHFVGLLGIACCGLGEIEEMQQCFNTVFDSLDDMNEKLDILGSYLSVLCSEEYYDDALQMVNSNESRFATLHYEWQELLIATYYHCDRQHELVKLADSLMPPKEASGIAAIKDLIDAINIIIFLKQWNKLGKYQVRMRKLIKDIPKQKDKAQAKKLFRKRYKYYKADHLRAAAVFMDFICRLDPDDVRARKQLEEIKSMLALSRIFD